MGRLAGRQVEVPDELVLGLAQAGVAPAQVVGAAVVVVPGCQHRDPGHGGKDDLLGALLQRTMGNIAWLLLCLVVPR